MESLKQTYVAGIPVPPTETTDAPAVPPSGSRLRPLTIELDETVDAAATDEAGRPSLEPGSTQIRTTVLPRRRRASNDPARPVAEVRPRFDRVKLLGAGAVGTVELVRDNDIRRTVAVKRLRSEARSHGALLRFADEVRIVGQLEHPNIVPVYDVGCDEVGDVYLVMKHLEGETMESVIEKLKGGDPTYVARFPVEYRAHLFLGVLDAVRYANARGVIHRDLKPANIMIGPYDEVTVMDWGIAKPVAHDGSGEVSKIPLPSFGDSVDGRLQETQLGALAGTPLYMSPEQASGLNDQLDERSDVYALGIVFYEWLTLHHPLEGKRTLLEVVGTLVARDYDRSELFDPAIERGVPIEFIHLVSRVLVRERERRLPSTEVFHERLKDLLDGRIPRDCPVTVVKRATHDVLRFVDRNPRGSAIFLMVSAVAVAAGMVLALIAAARSLA